MAELKLVIGNPKTKHSYKAEAKDSAAEVLMDKCIGQTVSGEELGFEGYEFLITGLSDNAGFPGRKGIKLARQKVLDTKSTGFSGKDRKGIYRKGEHKRFTVCGEKINTKTVQVNLKVIKEGKIPFVVPEKKEEKAAA